METKDFLLDLAGTGGIDINDYKTRMPLEKALGTKNKFFVCGYNKGKNTRVNDNDFSKKKYIFIDIDIRKSVYDREKRVITNDELREIIVDIGNILDGTGLADYSYSVFSGNGLHLYYVGDEIEICREEYENGVTYFHGMLNSYLSKLSLECDSACTNISRLGRLPGTINPRIKIETKEEVIDGEKIKNKIELWNMGDIVCEIITANQQKSIHVGKIKEYAKLHTEALALEKKNTEYVKKILRDIKGDDKIFEEINKIPAREIAETAWNVEYKECGKDNCPLYEGHKNMGAYYWKPSNVIVNTGSSLIKNKNEKYWTTYRLARDEMFSGDVKQTIDFFKTRYGIHVDSKGTIPSKRAYKKIGYVYGNSTFDAFDCTMSGELVVIVSKTNSGKTTFAMNMLQTNKELGKKGFYINLEFAIETVAHNRWLDYNGKTKRHLTDLAELTEEEQRDLDAYTKSYLSRFEYCSRPDGATIEELIDIMLEQLENGVGLFVIDTFSRIAGTLNSATARTSQNTAMEKLQEFVQNTGACIILLHHTNKAGDFEGSQKIMDLANVFITISKDTNARGDPVTKFELSKDKFVKSIDILAKREKSEYVLSN